MDGVTASWEILGLLGNSRRRTDRPLVASPLYAGRGNSNATRPFRSDAVQV